MPFFGESRTYSYEVEFSHALKKVISQQERKNWIEGFFDAKLVCAILFGSLSNKPPRMTKNGEGILDSDADIFLFFSGNKKPLLREIGIGPAFDNGKKFSDRIPNANVVVMNEVQCEKIAAMFTANVDAILQKAKAVLDPDYPIDQEIDAYHRAANILPNEFRIILLRILMGKLRDYSVYLQIILEGTVIQGEMPKKIVDQVQEVYETYTQSNQFLAQAIFGLECA